MPALAYMPFYTADFLADEAVSSMTFAERGLYITLMCHAWREGSIPCNVNAIARLVQRPIAEVRRSWNVVSQRFTACGDRLVQRRMEIVRKEVSATTQRRSDAGKKGASKRWESDSPAIPIALRIDGNQSQSQSNTETTSPQAKRREPWVKPDAPGDLPSTFPSELGDLKALAGTFLDAFANTRSPEAVEKNRPAYVDALAAFRNRGASVVDAWNAFGDARLAHDGKPLFGASAKNALSHLRKREPQLPLNGRSGPYDGVPVTIAAADRR